MPDMIRVRPAVAGTLVRNPNRAYRPLAAAGELVPASSFWLRRLAVNDVVDADAVEAAEKAAAAEKPPADKGDGSSEAGPAAPPTTGTKTTK